MFIVCFGDGLGNQMFQYAFYKSIKKCYSQSNVKMDIFHIYGSRIHNGFELEKIFSITKEECCKTDALILADYFGDHSNKYPIINFLFRIRRLIFGKKESYIVQEDATVFYEQVYKLNPLKSYIFRGNWINEKYFRDLKRELIDDFAFPPLQDEENKSYAQKILQAESVSVHIRRGDYLNYNFYELNENYYKTAESIIKENVKNPLFFLFTDDKKYVKENLTFFEDYVIVEGNEGEDSYIDMQLMSMCKHNIIANSTFSFWGAYLNKNKNKVVIAPNKAAIDIRYPFACEEWNFVDVEKNEK